MDAANFEQLLQERIKVKGKSGKLGGGVVTIERSKSKITVTSEVPFCKSRVWWHVPPVLGRLKWKDRLNPGGRGYMSRDHSTALQPGDRARLRLK
uniref:Large ribosomal subunit protein eL22 n=1 Tax=Cebus imitator TaxID=2715852 RepID=A0A2K5PR23_CEBIM